MKYFVRLRQLFACLAVLGLFGTLSVANVQALSPTAQDAGGAIETYHKSSPDVSTEFGSYEVAQNSKRKKRSKKYKSRKRVEIHVDLSKQRMSVSINGVHKHYWKVSSGRKGHYTPTGSYRPTRMHRDYYSRKYNNAPMPNSIFFYHGYAIHGTYQTRALGRPASRGCVRLSPANSARLFNLVKRYGRSNTRIRIVH